MIKRNSENKLDDAIIEFYKQQENEPTVKSVFDEWIQEKLLYGEIKRQSYDRYQTDFERFFYNEFYPLAERKIRYITEEELEKFIKTVVSRLGLTRKAYSGLLTLLRGIFKFSKKRNFTEISITNFLGDLELGKTLFTVKPRKKEVFSEEEIPEVLDYLKTHPDIWNLGLLLMFNSGMRIGEMSALKSEDLRKVYIKSKDMYKNIISVRRTEIKYKNTCGKCVVDVQEYPKSDAGIRDIIIMDEAAKICEKIKKLNPTGEYLFMHKDRRIRGNTFNKRLVSICEQIGVEPRTTHKIRKTYATTLYENGVDDLLICEMMGHKDIETTRRCYLIENKSDASKVEIMSKALAGIS